MTLRLIGTAATVAVAMSLAVSCGGGNGATGPSRTVASVGILPQTSSIAVGETEQLAATAYDASNNVISGQTVVWNSNSPDVAVVSPQGVVAAVATGTTQITAASNGVVGTAVVTVTTPTNNVTIVATNQLIEPVDITVNGSDIGQVPAQSTARGTVNIQGSMTIGYHLMRPTTTNGIPIGESMDGVYQTVNNPSGSYTVTVNNILSGQSYFAPLITNGSPNPMLMAVNWGLAAQVLCNCSVPPNAANVHIGYYHLFSNTEVRAYGAMSGYGNGAFVFWDCSTFCGGVQSGSGAVALSNTIPLFDIGPSKSVAVAGTSRAPTLRPLPSRSVAGHSLGAAARLR